LYADGTENIKYPFVLKNSSPDPSLSGSESGEFIFFVFDAYNLKTFYLADTKKEKRNKGELSCSI